MNFNSLIKRKVLIAVAAVTVAVVLTVGVIVYAMSQSATVTGKVSDANTGAALSGVTIVKKSSKNVTLTDGRGKYSMKEARGERLVFSFAGYTAAETVADRARVDVLLEPAKADSVGGSRDSAAGYAARYVDRNNPFANDSVKGSLTTAAAGADIFGKGGFATDIDAILSGVGGLKSGGDGGVGRKGVAGIGYGSGYGSGFGGGSGDVDDLLGGLMGGGYSGLELKKRGEVRVSGPSMYGGGYNSENNESYSSFAENRFKDASSEPLSTFSLDVDVASYGNVRRMINLGQKPPKTAVRIEQFINYFSYDYPKPTGTHPISIITETQACPWNKEHLLTRIGVKAKEVPSEKIPASNFVFLIDVSGSMSSPNRLPLVKSSLKLLTNNLRDKDRVSIVVYAGAAGTVLPSTSGADRQKIFEALDGLQAGGSTAGGEGIELAYKTAQKNFISGGNNRVILCTDGDFNVGVSSEKGLEKLIEEKRKTGVYLTVLGYGMGNYKDSKLQVLSQKGNGNHAYIDNLTEANRVLVQEFGSTMYAVAKDVKIQAEFNPAYVNAYRLVGYESRLLNKEDFNDDMKDAGELGAGHTVTAFYEIIPVGVKNRYGGVDSLKYQKNAAWKSAVGVENNELMNVKLRYKPLGSNVSVKMEVPVMAADKDKAPSADFTFASAVAMFGQLLRNSDFKGTSSYDNVVTLARKGFGEDRQGYRREFVRIAEAAKQLGAGDDDDIPGMRSGNTTRAHENFTVIQIIGDRSRMSVQRVIMQNMPALRYAYNKRVREKPGLTGRITVKFAVDEFGRVVFAQVAESTMADPELEKTVADRVKSYNFERLDAPGDVTEVIYPFIFAQ